MGEITDFVELYIQDSDILKEVVDETSMNLENSIKSEAPYDQGRLRRSIRVVSQILKDHAVITGYYDEGLAPHGWFVITGSQAVTNKLMKMPWGYRRSRKSIPSNDFLGRGLEKALEFYK